MSTVSVPQASTAYTLSSLQALKTHCPQQLSPDVWVNGGEKAQSRNGRNVSSWSELYIKEREERVRTER